jgi:hypothetical protein
MPMAGHQAGAAEKLQLGLKLLNESLSGLPLGSEVHKAVMDAINKLSEHLPQGMGMDPMGQMQQVAQLARGVRTQPPNPALMGMMGGAPPPPGAGASAPPPPAA